MKAKPDNNTDGTKTGKGRDANGKFVKGNSVGKPFKKGDPRINSKGRPKVFDDLRKLSQQIANEIATKHGAPIIINGHKVTVAEAIVRKLAMSNDPRFLLRFIEIAYGKVPDKLEVSDPNGKSLKTNVVFAPEELYETFRILQKANIGESLETEKPNSETE